MSGSTACETKIKDGLANCSCPYNSTSLSQVDTTYSPALQPSCSAGLPRREAGNAHTFLCMSATTRQLSATSAVLLTNAYHVYSEAAPEQARAGLTDAQRAAFPDLVGSEPYLDAAKTGSDVKATEFSTLRGAMPLVVHMR